MTLFVTNNEYLCIIATMRLDKYLHLNNFTTSRNQAQELIKERKVEVLGKIVTKSSFEIIDQEVKILVDTIYVSRGAYKLKFFLDTHLISVKDKNCLDIGSSTGGFVQVLCEKGASLVTAVDVGSAQLSKEILNNKKVKSFEKMDIRNFRSENSFEFVTCDVSFVGISHILKDIDRLSSDEIVILFKPQFEVGKEVKRDKRGVVKDSKAIIFACKKFEDLTLSLGWRREICDNSQLKGKDGNEEIFYYFKK